jgi:hypothetical protein
MAMKKYVATIVLISSPIVHETKTTVITISGSSLKELGQDFAGDLWTRVKSYIGEIFSFSIFCYSYGEFSKEKTSEFNKIIEKEVMSWNEEIVKEKSKQSELK